MKRYIAGGLAVSLTVSVTLAGAWAVARYSIGIFPSSEAKLRSLADVGQAFGPAAALLGALTLVGLLVTLRLQQKQMSFQRADMIATHDLMRRQAEAEQRGLHLELMRLALDDPGLMAVWPAVGITTLEKRRSVYVNLILSHQQTLLVAGYAPATTVLANLVDLFQSRTVQTFWETVGPYRRNLEIGTYEARLFHNLCDQACLITKGAST